MTKVPAVKSLHTRWDEVDGYRIFSRDCETAGADLPPVVLVHGLAMSSLYMVPTAKRLAAHYRVYAPDLPGYGRSQEPAGRLQQALDIDQLAQVLEDWMEQRGIGPTVLLGNSMGCQIIVSLARRRPEMVLKAVLVGPTIDRRARSALREFLRGAYQLLFEPLPFWAVMILDYARFGLRHTFQSLEDAIHDPVEQKLLEVTVPTLVVRGERDKIVSEGWAEEVVWRLPRGALADIRGAGHVVNFDAPDQLTPLVLEFLQD